MNAPIIAQWHANKAARAAAQGNMEQATASWQTAMERFSEYHYTNKAQDIEEV